MTEPRLENIYIGCHIPIKNQFDLIKEEYNNFHGDSVLWASLGSFEENLARTMNQYFTMKEALIAIQFYLKQGNPHPKTIEEITQQGIGGLPT